MGYMWITLGILGMLGCFWVYRVVDHRSFWYEVGLIGYILSWLSWVVGIWMVTK